VTARGILLTRTAELIDIFPKAASGRGIEQSRSAAEAPTPPRGRLTVDPNI